MAFVALPKVLQNSPVKWQAPSPVSSFEDAPTTRESEFLRTCATCLAGNFLGLSRRMISWRQKRAAPPILVAFHRRIATARRGALYEDRTQPARIALANWAVTEGRRPATEAVSSWQIEARAKSFRHAWNDPDGWKEIPDFDATLVGVLEQGGLRVSRDDPIIPLIRQ